MAHLIDSDVIVWALRGKRPVVDLLDRLADEDSIGCSAINVLEVESGAKPSEMALTRQHLEGYEVFPVTGRTAQKAAELLRAKKGKMGRGEWADAVIASTALLNDLTLVTFNRKHYDYPGLELYPIEPL